VPSRSEKKPITMRLSAEARRLLDRLATEFGVSQTAIVELAIREKAKREGVE
jgi:predicted transcriptional regulator